MIDIAEIDFPEATPADLGVGAVVFTPGKIAPGGVVPVSATIVNNASVDVPFIDVVYYVSTDGVLDASDIEIGRVTNRPGLAGGASRTLSALLAPLPVNTPEGFYFVLAEVFSSGDEIPDPVAANDVGATPSATLDVDIPDIVLSASAPVLSAGAYRPGDVMPASSIVQSLGELDAAAYSVKYYLSSDQAFDLETDTLLATQNFAGLAVGQSALSSPTIVTPETLGGEFYVIAVVESDVFNTGVPTIASVAVSAQTITVLPSFKTLSAGSPLNTIVVGDKGNLQVIRDGFAAGQFGSASSIPGASGILIRFSDGRLFGFLGDQLVPVSQIVRSVGAGVDTAAVSPAGAPSFRLDQATTYQPGRETVRILNTITNTGTAGLTFDVIYAADLFVGNDGQATGFVDPLTGAVGGMDASGNYSVYVRSDTSVGPGHDAFQEDTVAALFGRITSGGDLLGTVGSGLRDDAVALQWKQITLDPGAAITVGVFAGFGDIDVVSPLPDLNPQIPILGLTNALAGSSFAAAVDVTNRGLEPSGVFNVRFVLTRDGVVGNGDDIPIGVAPAASIGSGVTLRVSETLRIPSFVASGGYRLAAVVDAGNLVAEAFEDNNIAVSAANTVNVLSPPLVDLVANSVSAPGGIYRQLQPLNISVTVTSVGGAAIFPVSVFLSLDGSLDPTDLLVGTIEDFGLAQGQTRTQTINTFIPADAPNGAYRLILAVNSTGQIGETTLANNTTISGSEIVQVVRSTPVSKIPGTLDLTFGGGDGIATTIIPAADLPPFQAAATRRLPDGRQLVAGFTTTGDRDFVLIRFNADGTLDTTFGQTAGFSKTSFGFVDEATSLAIDPAGRIYVAGVVTRTIDGVTDAGVGVIRYTAEGLLDLTYGDFGALLLDVPGVTGVSQDIINAAVTDASGRLVLGGSITIDGNTDSLLLRLNPDGSLDTSFGNAGEAILAASEGFDGINDIVIDSRGRIVVAGVSTLTNGRTTYLAARFDSTGRLDARFGRRGIYTRPLSIADAEARTLAIAANGDIVLGGFMSTGDPDAGNFTSGFAVVRLTDRGRLRTTYNRGVVSVGFDGLVGAVTDIAFDEQGNVIASGKVVTSLNFNGEAQIGVASIRLTSRGRLDPTYGIGGRSIVLQPVGSETIVIAARFRESQGELGAKFEQLLASARGLIEMTQGGGIVALATAQTPGGDTQVDIATILTRSVDAVVNGISRLPSQVNPGQRVTARVNIANAGSSRLSGRFNVEMFVSSDDVFDESDRLVLSRRQRISLRPQQARDYTLRLRLARDLAEGAGFVFVRVTGQGVNELRTDNNTSTPTAITIGNPPPAAAAAFAGVSAEPAASPSSAGLKPFSDRLLADLLDDDAPLLPT